MKIYKMIINNITKFLRKDLLVIAILSFTLSLINLVSFEGSILKAEDNKEADKDLRILEISYTDGGESLTNILGTPNELEKSQKEDDIEYVLETKGGKYFIVPKTQNKHNVKYNYKEQEKISTARIGYTYGSKLLANKVGTPLKFKTLRNQDGKTNVSTNKSPNSIGPAHLNLGIAYTKNNLIDKAIPEFKNAMEHNPHHLETHLYLGAAYGLKGMVSESMSEFKKATDINMQKAVTRSAIINEELKVKDGNLEEKIIEARKNLANAYRDIGKLERAKLEYIGIFEILPDSPTASGPQSDILYELGILYIREDKYDKAVNVFGKALKINPYAPKINEALMKAHHQLGLHYAENNDLDKAIIEFDKALKTKQGPPKTNDDLKNEHYQRGLDLAKNMELDKAISELKKARGRKIDTLHTTNNGRNSVEITKSSQASMELDKVTSRFNNQAGERKISTLLTNSGEDAKITTALYTNGRGAVGMTKSSQAITEPERTSSRFYNQAGEREIDTLLTNGGEDAKITTALHTNGGNRVEMTKTSQADKGPNKAISRFYNKTIRKIATLFTNGGESAKITAALHTNGRDAIETTKPSQADTESDEAISRFYNQAVEREIGPLLTNGGEDAKITAALHTDGGDSIEMTKTSQVDAELDKAISRFNNPVGERKIDTLLTNGGEGFKTTRLFDSNERNTLNQEQTKGLQRKQFSYTKKVYNIDDSKEGPRSSEELFPYQFEDGEDNNKHFIRNVSLDRTTFSGDKGDKYFSDISQYETEEFSKELFLEKGTLSVGKIKPPYDLFSEYRIQAGDVLDVLYQVRTWEKRDEFTIAVDHTVAINFLHAPELNQEQVIRPDGKVTLPYLGEVFVIGMTVDELTDKLTKDYSNILQAPEIFITIPEFQRSIKELKKDLHTATRGLSRLVTVRPDGYVTFAMLGDMFVSGETIPDISKILNEKYEELLPGLHCDLFLEKGAGSVVYVLGEVRSPGAYTVKKPITVIEAITLAGSYVTGANLRNVVIARKHEDKMVVTKMNIKKTLGMTKDGKFIYLQPDDIVYVPQRFIKTLGDVMTDIANIFMFKGWSTSAGFSYELHKANSTDGNITLE